MLHCHKNYLNLGNKNRACHGQSGYIGILRIQYVWHKCNVLTYGNTKLETPVPVRSLKFSNLGHVETGPCIKKT